MATKRAREERVKEDKERRYGLAVKSLRNFPLIAIGISVLFLMLFLLDFGYIYNTGMNSGKGGIEVHFSGFNAFFAMITGGYSSADKIYGDIAVPFYYYAKDHTVIICVFSFIAILFTVSDIVVSVLNVALKKPFLSVVSLCLKTLTFISALVAFIAALAMANSQILPVYCSGNPACSIKSLAIIPAIIAAIGAAISAIASVKFFKAKKILK